MKSKPSEHFLGAILRGFDKEARSGKPVTCSGIWDQVVMECWHAPGGFTKMFEWDTTRGAQNRNRIGTIAECVRDGVVPGLRLDKDARGHEIVVMP